MKCLFLCLSPWFGAVKLIRFLNREDRGYPATTDQHVAYPTQTENTDAINLSVENCTQNYTNLDNYS